MDLKKIKIFSISIFVASILLIATFFGLKALVEYIATKVPKDFTIDSYNSAKNAWIALSIIFAVIIVISWLSLIIQTCRIDDPAEAHFFIWMSIFSFVPLFSLVIVFRVSHLLYKERNEKLTTLVSELEEKEQIEIEQYENQEVINDLNYNVSEENYDFIQDNELVYDDFPKNKSKKKNKKDLSSKEDKDKKNDNDAIDLSDKSKTSNKKENFTKSFNREKYLSLKGTNYSKEKKEGKKKISNGKWNKLIALVDQLENNEISEKNFYKEKSKLLSN